MGLSLSYDTRASVSSDCSTHIEIRPFPICVTLFPAFAVTACPARVDQQRPYGIRAIACVFVMVGGPTSGAVVIERACTLVQYVELASLGLEHEARFPHHSGPDR